MHLRLISALALSLSPLFGLFGLACQKSDAPPVETPVEPSPKVTAAAMDQATEAPARAVGLKLGFAYTANLMGELEPCG